jgi:glycosyltransferase involved in cell wall biosynthesis
VSVLTSSYRAKGWNRESHVLRLLTFDESPGVTPGLSLLLREMHDTNVVHRAIARCDPEVILVFSLHGVPHSIARELQKSGRKVVFAFSAEWLLPGFINDPWLYFWRRPASNYLKEITKRILEALVAIFAWTGREPLDLGSSFFTSRRLKEIFAEKGFPVDGAAVIHWGVDLEKFRPSTNPGARSKLLFAGRIVPEKGLHTVVEALRLIADENGPDLVRCTVAGPAQDPSYLQMMKRNIEGWGLQSSIEFIGEIRAEEMPGLYRSNGCYLLPSIWEEPFSIGLLEAMASGLVPIASPTGGTPEIVRDGVNGLLFDTGRASELAAAITRVVREQRLYERLGRGARETVETGFGIEKMVAEVEAFLLTTHRNHSP